MKIPNHLKKAYNIAIKKGWTVSFTGKGHLKWKDPAGPVYYTASTASCHRGRNREATRLKNAGLNA